MRILAKGRTRKECEMDMDIKEKRGWKALAGIKLDDSYIGGRYVCVMEKEDNPNSIKSNFNQYLGH